MGLYELLIIFHLLLFVYWLGADLGVFYSSGMVLDPKLSNSARAIAAKIMINLDFVPRICMTLMLTVGGLLTEFNGIEHPLWQTIGFLLLGPFWLGMVLFIHFNEGKPIGKAVTKIDYYFRWALVTYLLCSVTFYTFFSDRADLQAAPWVSAKLAIFAVLVWCGLRIRKFIPGYVIGVHKLYQDESSDEINESMSKSLAKCRPYVYVIWVGLVTECYLGVVQPGDSRDVLDVLSSLAPVIGL